MLYGFLMTPGGDAEGLAHQETEQGIEKLQGQALPGRDRGAVSAPGMQCEFAVVQDVKIDPNLQIHAAAVHARFKFDSLGRWPQKFGLLRPLRGVPSPQAPL